MCDKKATLLRLICFAGTQEKLGKLINRKQRIISEWLNGKPIPIKKALELEKIAIENGLKHITAKKLTPELEW